MPGIRDTDHEVSPEFAGRTAELTLLTEAYERARAGVPGAVLIAAEAAGESADAFAHAEQTHPLKRVLELLAYALLRAAEAAVVAGRRDDTVSLLDRAACLTEQLRARPLCAEISLFTRRARLSPTKRAAVSGPSGPTAREQEVLRLLAAGRSNREIAEELFIATKTASGHVSAILPKLRVSSRGEAVATARRLRILS